ncbi:MAG: Choline binding protein [Anaerocolumna sp.]|nr:Choline binding protein [Anaerocolumna sp.]
MNRNIKISKTQLIRILLFSCLFLSVFVVTFKVSAKEKYPYYIKVNKLQNCVTIYKADENGKYTVPVKAMACSTGPATPLGTYNTLVKYRWKLLMGDVWGQYSTRIVKGILFHSVWYYKMDPSTLSTTQYNKLGSSASHGCIRLSVVDAKWIYDNCGVGTTVEIYNDKDPGPLGKPESIKIPAGVGWDPTDPSKDNPYNSKSPFIHGAKSQTITWGTKIDLLKGVKAISSTGMDITAKIKVEGNVDIYTAGKYKIKYEITDAIGRTATKSITVVVKESKEKPTFKGVTDRYIDEDTVVDKDFALEGVSAYLATMKLSSKDIVVKITEEAENTYKVEYSITAGNKLTGTATATFLIDNTAPVLTGVNHRELTYNQLTASTDALKKYALKGVNVADDHTKLSTSDIKVSIKAKEDYAYYVTYKVEDKAGNVTSETVQFTYFESSRIDGVSNHIRLPYGTLVTKDFVKEGVTATNSLGEDITDTLTIKLSSYAGEEYKVTYSVTNDSGQVISIVCYYTVSLEPTDSDDMVVESSNNDDNSDNVNESNTDEEIESNVDDLE